MYTEWEGIVWLCSGKYRQGVFELFNIIASKLDQIHGQEGYGEKVIKDCLEEFDRVIEERQNQKWDHSKLKQVVHF